MEIPIHIQKLIDEAKAAPPDSRAYWKLRCLYREKMEDETYSQVERDNCFALWKILAHKI